VPRCSSPTVKEGAPLSVVEVLVGEPSFTVGLLHRATAPGYCLKSNRGVATECHPYKLNVWPWKSIHSVTQIKASVWQLVVCNILPAMLKR